MKIKCLLIVCFIVGLGICFAQNVVTGDAVQITSKNLENANKSVIPSNRIILAEMKTNNPVMYSQYQSGKKMQITGIIMTGVSGGLVVAGAIFSIIPDADRGRITSGPIVIETDGNHSGLRKAGPVLMVVGAACLSVGLPVMIVGGKKKKQTFQDYKYQYYLSQQPSSYFQMNINPNKVGIAYVF